MYLTKLLRQQPRFDTFRRYQALAYQIIKLAIMITTPKVWYPLESSPDVFNSMAKVGNLHKHYAGIVNPTNSQLDEYVCHIV